MTGRIVNFGGNVRFTPRRLHAPRSEAELLEVLDAHRDGQVRAVGSRHSWSGAIVSADALVDMRHFDAVRIRRDAGGARVSVGAGCRIERLLRALDREGLTTPSVGLITEQTIAGAISTGTHGSGRHSLSHYVDSLRIACYGADGTPEIREVSEGPELRAARCGLGCLGVIVEVRFRSRPQYLVRESLTVCDAAEEALALEARSPLLQFYLIPHLWRCIVQERSLAEGTTRSASAPLYRLYWWSFIDVGLHLAVKLSAAALRSRRLVHLLYRHVLPAMLFPRWVVTDRSDRALVMEHELFRHLETELFVPRSRTPEAAAYVTQVLQVMDGSRARVDEPFRSRLQALGMLDALEALRGGYVHHYPICFRRVLRDDTLISMAAGGEDAWYAISFITYAEPREPFYRAARFLAGSMAALFGARPHWGKWFPLPAETVERLYPRLAEFRAIRARFDPRGVFGNEFTESIGASVRGCRGDKVRG